MPFLLRLLLAALAGIWLVGARHASQHAGTQPAEAAAALGPQAGPTPVAGPRW